MNGFIQVGNEYVNVSRIEKITLPSGDDPAFVQITGWESPIPWRRSGMDAEKALTRATSTVVPADGWVLRFYGCDKGKDWHRDAAVVAFRISEACDPEIILATGEEYTLDENGLALISPSGLVTTGYDNFYPSWAAFKAPAEVRA